MFARQPSQTPFGRALIASILCGGLASKLDECEGNEVEEEAERLPAGQRAGLKKEANEIRSIIVVGVLPERFPVRDIIVVGFGLGV